MRTAPSLDRIITGLLLLLSGTVLVARLAADHLLTAQVSPSCGNTVSGETYGACTTTADCAVGACVAGVCTEQCDGGTCCDATCRYKSPSTICRNKVGPCDSPERCSGDSSSCPSDSIYVAGTICRASTGACDSAERCDGVTVDCPSDTLLSGPICRQASGACDLDERCNGAMTMCPTDIFQPKGSACDDGNACTADSCDGANRCVSQSLPDGTPCTLPNRARGVCYRNSCIAATSSSAFSLSSSARSSSSRAVSSMASSSVHIPLPMSLCGNGLVEGGEDCDGGDNCGSNCRFKALYCCAGGRRTQIQTSLLDAHPGIGSGISCSLFGTMFDAGSQVTGTATAACTCGDGLIDTGEECDTKNIGLSASGSLRICRDVKSGMEGPLSCTALCRLDTSACVPAICGDGIIQPPEQCDSFGRDSEICNRDCTLPVCGDGRINMAAGEHCDNGSKNIDGVLGACRTDCTFAICGDGLLDAPEECDDGNTDDGDGCSAACANEPIYCCYQGVRVEVTALERTVAPMELVEGGDCHALSARFDAYTPVSHSATAPCPCGDGILEDQEWCDGKMFATNSNGESLNRCQNVPWLGPSYTGTVTCASDCTLDDSRCEKTGCGNGRIDRNEDCDGTAFAARADGKVLTCGDFLVGSTRGNLRCNADCTIDSSACIPAHCGDKVIDAGEQCDDGGQSALCDDDCTLAQCGDGFVNPLAGEECDEGLRNDNFTANACRENCRQSFCGDQILDAGEQCDDGNTINGDGCSSECQFQQLQQCSQSVCEDCAGAAFCAREICQSLGCQPTTTDFFGWIFATFGNPLGLESYHCAVAPECPGR